MKKITYVSFVCFGLTLFPLLGVSNNSKIYEYLSANYINSLGQEEITYIESFFSPQIDGLSKASKPKK